MNESKNSSHSFLFWLAIPVLISWFAFNYVKAVLFFKGEGVPIRNSVQASSLEPLTMRDYPALPDNKNGYVTLWFDDAWLSQYLKGASLLKEYGYLGALAVPTDAVEQNNYMNWAQIKVLQESGWEITNHSRTHSCNMQNWDRNQIREEYRESTLSLWGRGLSSDIFVTPCGVDSEIMQGEAIKQFSAYRTVDPGFNDPSNLDPYAMKIKNIDHDTSLDEMKSWVSEAKTDKKWLIIVFHQIGSDQINSTEETYGVTENDFRELLNYIKESAVDVILPGQILYAN